MSRRSVAVERLQAVIHYQAQRLKGLGARRQKNTVTKRQAPSDWHGMEPLEQRMLLSVDLPFEVLTDFDADIRDTKTPHTVAVNVSLDDVAVKSDSAIFSLHAKGTGVEEEGRFDPASVVIRDDKGIITTPILVVDDLEGSTDSLVLAELKRGGYTFEVVPQKGTKGSFHLDVGLFGYYKTELAHTRTKPVGVTKPGRLGDPGADGSGGDGSLSLEAHLAALASQQQDTTSVDAEAEPSIDDAFGGGITYSVTIGTGEIAKVPFDFDNNGYVDAGDIDTISEAVRDGDTDLKYDLDNSADVTAADRIDLLQVKLGFDNGSGVVLGDLNLDRSVSNADLSTLSLNFGTSNVGWAEGDITGDGNVSVADLSLFSLSYGWNGSPWAVAALANDTAPFGIKNHDNYSSDSTITGQVIAHGSATVTNVLAWFDSNPGPHEDITSELLADNRYTLDQTLIETINGGPLSDGVHTLHIQVTDSSSNVGTRSLDFTLDTTNPTSLSFGLIAGHQGSSENLANMATINLEGNTEDDIVVHLQQVDDTVQSGSGPGDFSFIDVPLNDGLNELTVVAYDDAGNSASLTRQIGYGGSMVTLEESSANFVVKDDSTLIDIDQTIGGVAVEAARTLRIDVDAYFDTTDTQADIEDVFQIYLVNTEDDKDTLLDNGAPGTAVFSLAGDVAEYTPGLVSYDGSVVEIDLTSLGDLGASQGKLIYRLINSDSDTDSFAFAKIVSNELDLTGSENPVLPMSHLVFSPGAPLPFPAGMTPTTDIEVLISNVWVESDNDIDDERYFAEVQVKNNGTTNIGRDVGVVFDGLPSDVSIFNKSGDTAVTLGDPYINMRNAIQPGGLAPGTTSGPVQIQIDNVTDVAFEFTTAVYIGAANQAPTLEMIGNVTVNPGDHIEIPVIANDLDSDPLSFSISSASGDLPSSTFKADGTLVLTPTTDDVSATPYQVTITASDGALTASRTFDITVEDDPVSSTRISGKVTGTMATTLHVAGNTWKKLHLDPPISIGYGATLELDFMAPHEGEIHAIGFTNDEILANVDGYQFYGIDTWQQMNQSYRNYTANDGMKHYSINTGQHVMGTYSYVVLVNDEDVQSPNAESYFSNIRVIEGSNETFIEFPTEDVSPYQHEVQDLLTTVYSFEDHGNPLEGILVQLIDDDTGSVIADDETNAAGEFIIDAGFNAEIDADNYTLKINGNTFAEPELYPVVPEKLGLVLGREPEVNIDNHIHRPIFLPIIDRAGGTYIADPEIPNTVTQEIAPGEFAEIFIDADTVELPNGDPYIGNVSITEVPADLTPAALPANLFPDLVVTIQPDETVSGLTFADPAPLTLPNRADWPIDTEMILWSIDPVDGTFANVGTGIVADDPLNPGVDNNIIITTDGGINNSSWHFWGPIADNVITAIKNMFTRTCGCATEPLSSEVELHSGAVIEAHDLVTYQSMGETRGLRLTYDSLRADPRPIVEFGFDDMPGGGLFPFRLATTLSISNGKSTVVVPGHPGGLEGFSGGEHFWKLPELGGDLRGALQADLSNQPTGMYEYELSSGVFRKGPSGRYTGSMDTDTQPMAHINSIDSPFGSGWGLAGLQQLLLSSLDDSILLIDGDGSEWLYQSDGAGGYISPSGDFSILAYDSIGAQYTRTEPDNTVFTYKSVADGTIHLKSISDRNGNTTQYVYNASTGLLEKVIDPVGRETVLVYESGKVRFITDPTGRITELTYDTDGNLIKITDPDSTSRTFEYDDLHHMTAETNKQGDREQAFYDFAGRATGAVRADGTRITVDPVQTQSLLPPFRTINPDSAPLIDVMDPFGTPGFRLSNFTKSYYADSNGYTSVATLDSAGQLITKNDGGGNQTSIEREPATNLVTTSVDARGFSTEYIYDNNGNLIQINEPFLGNGPLFPNQIIPTGSKPKSVLLHDVNHDANLDLITMDEWDRNVSVRLGNGAGTFGERHTYNIGTVGGVDGPVFVTVADMDNDGDPDLIVAADEQAKIHILLGNGFGGFDDTNPIILEDVGTVGATQGHPFAIAIADIDSNGYSDLAIANRHGQASNDISVILRGEEGSYLDEDNYNLLGATVANGSDDIVLADMNNDGHLDLVTANYSSGTVSIVPGDGTGNFDVASEITLEVSDTGSTYNPIAIATGYLNDDNYLDIAVTSNDDNKVTGFLSDGSGGYLQGGPGIDPTYVIPVEGNPGDIDLADLDGDGVLDLVLTHYEHDKITIYRGEDDGLGNPTGYFDTMTAPAELHSLTEPSATDIGDIDNDNILDIVTANFAISVTSSPSISGSSTSVFLGTGNGEFSTSSTVDVGNRPEAISANYIDEDEYLDLVVANNLDGDISILLGDGVGGFNVEPSTWSMSGSSTSPLQILTDDLNGDLKQDVITSNSNGSSTYQLEIYYGDGLGSFSSSMQFALPWVYSIRTGHLNSDPYKDIIGFNILEGDYYVLLGQSDGTFQQSTYSLNDIAFFVDGVLVDTNNDDILDIVGVGNAEYTPDKIFLLLGNGDGTFADPTFPMPSEFSIGISNFNSITTADFNHDNQPDFILPVSDFTGRVILSDLDGPFANYFDLTTEYAGLGESVVASDINADGHMDIAMANSTNGGLPIVNSITFFPGNGDGTFGDMINYGVGIEPSDLVVADFNDDGFPDIATANSLTDDVSILTNFGGLSVVSRSFTYDPTFNQLTSETDELGHQILYDIDPANGNTLEMRRVIGVPDTPGGEDDDLVTSYEYTSTSDGDPVNGLIKKITDPNGIETVYTYTSKTLGDAEDGWLKSITYAANSVDDIATVHYEYDQSTTAGKAGIFTAFIDENSYRTEYEYDALLRITKITEADPDDDTATGGTNGPLASPVTNLTYDNNGNIKTVTDALGRVTTNIYDEMDRLIQTTDALGQRTIYKYDNSSNIVKVIDPLLRVTHYVYDNRNRLIQTTDPEGGITKFAYDPNDNRNVIIDPEGNLTRFVYDTRNRLVREIDALGNLTNFLYDAADNLIGIEDQERRKTTYIYDDADRLKQIINPDLTVRKTFYDKASNVVQQNDELDRITTFEYDDRNRIKTTILPDPITGGETSSSPIIQYTYNDAGRLTNIIDANDNDTAFIYDNLNRLIQTVFEDPDDDPVTENTPETSQTYDAVGNVLTSTDEMGNTTRYAYDDVNRLTMIVAPDPDGTGSLAQPITRFTYDAVGNQLTLTDPLDQVTTNQYDGLNRLTKTINPDSVGEINYTYYDNGNLKTLKDPEDNTTEYFYDELNRLAKETDPQDKDTLYEYDNVGNRTAMVDREGRRTEYVYDERDRRTHEYWINADGSTIDHTIAYTYDPVGNLEMLVELDDTLAIQSSLDFNYDKLDRIIDVSNAGTPGVPAVVIDYTYDLAGNVTHVTDDQDGLTIYTYDGLHRLEAITQEDSTPGTGPIVTNKRVDFAYNQLGQYETITRRDGLLVTSPVIATSDYQYDDLNRLTYLGHDTATSTPINNYTFTYDVASQIKTIDHKDDGLFTYTYDVNSRLEITDHLVDNTLDENYDYDDNGNRIESHLHGTDYDTDLANELTTDGTYDYFYDDEGNLITRENILQKRTYGYDYRNRLISVADIDLVTGFPTQIVTYTYDGLNRRISKSVDIDGDLTVDTTTYFVYDREDVILDFVDADGDGLGSSVLDKRYLHGPGADTILAQEDLSGSTGVLWLLTDHLGTTRDIVDNTGAVQNHIKYGSFGRIIDQSDETFTTRYLYTGREWDGEISLYYYRARFYDPSLGRFTQRDLIGFSDGTNQYEYVRSMPINHIDPFGLFVIVTPPTTPSPVSLTGPLWTPTVTGPTAGGGTLVTGGVVGGVVVGSSVIAGVATGTSVALLGNHFSTFHNGPRFMDGFQPIPIPPHMLIQPPDNNPSPQPTGAGHQPPIPPNAPPGVPCGGDDDDENDPNEQLRKELGLRGNNPRPSGNRYNTDLPGGEKAAKDLFRNLTNGKSSQSPNGHQRGPQGELLRQGKAPDNRWRVDIPKGTHGNHVHETIHFNP